jgi:CheY-like chemotaxis protein
MSDNRAHTDSRPVSGTVGMTLSPSLVLTDRRVLVVEDEALVSMLLEDMLEDLGCKVLGPLMRVGDALAFLAEPDDRIDVAILDVNLAGERSSKVAEALRAKGVPFVLSTGYDDSGIEEELRGGPILRKPFLAAQLESVLREALGEASAA